MDDGLYKVEFSVPAGSSSGVVVLQGGRLRGGDSVLFYLGSYSVDGDRVAAEVRTQRHAPPGRGHSVFGLDAVKLQLEGSGDGRSAQLRGMAAEAPDVQFAARLTWLGD